MKCYKLRDSRSELYSTGGMNSATALAVKSGNFSRRYWKLTGKVWKSIGALKNHLHYYVDYQKSIPETLVVEEYELVKVAEYPAAKLLEVTK